MFKSECKDEKVALIYIFLALFIDGFTHWEQLKLVQIQYLYIFLVFHIFQFSPFFIMDRWTRLLLFLYALLIHEWLYFSTIPQNFGNTHDSIEWPDDGGNKSNGMCDVNDETQVGAMSHRIMAAEFNHKKLRLKPLTFDNRLTHDIMKSHSKRRRI